MTNCDLNDNFNSTLYTDHLIFKGKLSKVSALEILPETRTLFFVASTDAQAAVIDMINSMAKACQLSPNDYQICTAFVPWHTIRASQQIKEIILFGNIEKELGLNITLPLHYKFLFDTKTWIKSLNAPILLENKDAKTALWNQALKSHFITQ